MAKRPKKWPTSDYESGYCRPPDHGKIKKGEVRNPWGPKGKPKPETVDPFEFAASRPVPLNLDGKVVEVTAETAAHLKNMSAAIAGDPRAHKNVQDERRSRRRSQPVQTAEDVRQQIENDAAAEKARSRLVEMLDWGTSLKKDGMLAEGRFKLADWVHDAIGDYREGMGLPRNPGLGGRWDPHPEPSGEEID